jgi:hypothetical protein
MPGNITRATDKSIEETISGLRTALAVIDNANKIFIPPIPRYMFGGCCADSSHAPNTREPEHAKDTLTDHTRIRNKLKQCIITKGKTNTRILDVISALAEDHQSPTDKIKALRIHTSTTTYISLRMDITTSKSNHKHNNLCQCTYTYKYLTTYHFRIFNCCHSCFASFVPNKTVALHIV